MRLRNLRYFLAVAEEKSFARAAARVHIDPSPLSRAIRAMEAELGVRLIDQQQGHLQLTRAGEAFRDEARRMLSFMEGARARVRAAEHGGRGQLRIGLADHLAQPPLIRLLTRCREEEPHIEIRILEMNIGEMVKALNQDRIDAGFTVHPEPDKTLRRIAVWRDRLAVALPGNHPLLALKSILRREIVQCPVLLFHPESCPGGYDIVRRWLFNTAAFSPGIAEYVSSHEAMLMLTAAGQGVGIGAGIADCPVPHPRRGRPSRRRCARDGNLPRHSEPTAFGGVAPLRPPRLANRTQDAPTLMRNGFASGQFLSAGRPERSSTP